VVTYIQQSNKHTEFSMSLHL